MCGIAGIVLKEDSGIDIGHKIERMSSLLKHRGPDGEGFFVAHKTLALPYSGKEFASYRGTDINYIPKTRLADLAPGAFLAFAHRRLSIIDLSETGHQPMCSRDETLWITFNGEIYNYIELRQELIALGHQFTSESDTEVVLNAYLQWGTACVSKFNGMWAFCIFDKAAQTCFASRDRLGVKPFYYIDRSNLFAFASEQKALTGSGLVKAAVGRAALYNYVVNEVLENNTANFFEGITELWPGTNLLYDIRKKNIVITPYYQLSEKLSLTNNGLSDAALADRINHTLETAVRLRLRSDVEVGTCLSGGIDSSVLAVIMASLLQRPVHCFTSVFKGHAANEEFFADLVAKKINALHFKSEPKPDGFFNEVDNLVYSQDAPIWSTSTYAQYKVMELARIHNIKVVLDGQGADELFAGYHHHFVARWNNLLRHGRIREAFTDLKAAKKSIPGPVLFYAKENLKRFVNIKKREFEFFLHEDFLNANGAANTASYYPSVNEQLLDDIYNTRLKTFLKCEDRCGMWHGVESRTPFSDDPDLMELLFSFDGNRKIKNGVSKYLLREATKTRLPAEIYNRYDKKGFETPMQDWVSAARTQLLSEIKAADLSFVNYKSLESCSPNNTSHNKLLFKLFILARWQRVFNAPAI